MLSPITQQHHKTSFPSSTNTVDVNQASGYPNTIPPPPLLFAGPYGSHLAGHSPMSYSSSSSLSCMKAIRVQRYDSFVCHLGGNEAIT